MIGWAPGAPVWSRWREVTADQARGWLPWSAVAASCLTLAVVAVHVVFQRRTDLSQAALSWALAVLVPSLVLANAPRVVSATTGTNQRGLTAWLLALNAGLLLLVVPGVLAVWQTDWDAITGWRVYPFFNKRWLAALYSVGLLTFLVFPVWFERWLTPAPAEVHPQAAAVSSATPPWWRLTLECAALLLAVWYLAGPPWNVGTHHRAIDPHEQVHLGPIQAIAKGYTPFIGPASTQYGPGFQVMVYGYMSRTDQFNLVGFREAFLLLHLVSFAGFALLARAHVGFGPAWLVVLLGVICSPLTFFQFMADGTPGDTYGWGNALRYMGPLVVVPAVGILLTRSVAHGRWLTVALGVTWGLLAWSAQESLASVISAGGLLVLLLLGTGSTRRERVVSTLIALAAGFAAVWLPLLAWYASQGAMLTFINNYLLVPRAVAAGFSNTWWADGPDSSLARAFDYLPVIILVLGALILWDPATRRVRRPLTSDQVRLLSFLGVLAACYQSTLFRSDSLHLLNTLLVLPFVLVLTFRDLPGWLSATWTGRAGVRAAFAVVCLTVFPLTPPLTAVYDWILFPPTYKYQARAAIPPDPAIGVAFERATPGLRDEPTVMGEGSGPMRQFLTDASALRRLIGNRPTFVQSAGPYFTGLVYFMADLTPAPYLYDLETMVFNDRQQNQAWAHFRGHLNEVECVVVGSADAFEARAFMSANPTARVYPRRLGATSVLVIMNGEPAE